jgi:hypothetical protein
MVGKDEHLFELLSKKKYPTLEKPDKSSWRNWCILNAKQTRWKYAQYPITLSNNNLTARYELQNVVEHHTSEYKHGGWSTVIANHPVSSGVHDWYVKIPDSLYGWLLTFGIVADGHPLTACVGTHPDSYGYSYDGNLVFMPQQGCKIEHLANRIGRYVSPGMIVKVQLDMDKGTVFFTVGGPTSNPNLVQPPIGFRKINTKTRYRLAVSLDYSFSAVTLLPQDFSFQYLTNEAETEVKKEKSGGIKSKLMKLFSVEDFFSQ